ncbi:MAG: hypothetical protein HY007_00935 [Candidatus Sungbacteria bacterium]|nr:hypothetical protein [Candidatus Sungbacteria bacterium]
MLEDFKCPAYDTASRVFEKQCPGWLPVRELRAVNVNSNSDGWNVNANSVDDPNRWNDDNRVFSRNCCVSPA